MPSQVESQNTPAAMRNYAETIKSAKHERRHHEEIYGSNRLTMIFQERHPSIRRFGISRAFAFFAAVLAPNYRNQVLQFSMNPRRWEIYIVGYRAEPEDSAYPPRLDPADTNPYLENPNPKHRNPHIFYNFSGVILRVISKAPGIGGIGGAYKDAGIILKPGPDSQSWEGIQGTDSFFPYKVKDKWYAFYGSCHCESCR